MEERLIDAENLKEYLKQNMKDGKKLDYTDIEKMIDVNKQLMM